MNFGITVDTMGATRVSVIYFYDANNAPRWVLGNGDNAIAAEMGMLSFVGFCPDCEFQATTNEAAGTLGLQFGNLRQASVSFSVDYPGVTASTWTREAAIIPLSNPPVNLLQ